MEDNVIELRHISKSFPGIKANDDVSLTLRKGEIHALLGENGAGKSTLMSILFGLYEPDEGEILVNGEPAKIKNPNDATRYRIGMVHQHFKLVECYSALENIILGYEPVTKHFGFLKPKSVRQSLIDLCAKYKFDVDLDRKVEDMTVGEQQKVEILKMLYRKNNILIFDEPTAVLTPQEIENLMVSMKELVKEGCSILFISHKLNEIMEVADRVTVLRKGRCVGTINIKDTNPKELSRLMVGRDVELVTKKKPLKVGDVVLELNKLSIFNEEKKKDVVNGVSFTVHKGEIVCLAGIEGNGQTELIYGLTGLSKISHGEAILHNVDRYRYLKLDKDNKENKINHFCRHFFGSITCALATICENIKEFWHNKVWRHCKKFFIDFGRKISSLFWKLFKKNKEFIPFVIDEPYKKKHFLSPKQVDLLPRYSDVHLEDLSIRKRSISGISHIPEDRQKYGLALDFSLQDNLVLQRYFENEFSYFGFLRKKNINEYAKKLISEYDVRSSLGPNTIVRSMSGGNQQKAIIARELDRDCPLIIAVQPTRGLDVGAIEYIHNRIIKKRDEGCGVLLVSLELDEVMNLSDRILVMHNGEIVAELDPKKTNVNEIGLYMSGAKKMDLKTHKDIIKKVEKEQKHEQ